MATYCTVLKSLNWQHRLKKDQHIKDEKNALYIDQMPSLHWCYKHNVVNVYHNNDNNLIIL